MTGYPLESLLILFHYVVPVTGEVIPRTRNVHSRRVFKCFNNNNNIFIYLLRIIMKKIAILFSIFLILNIPTTIESLDPLENLIKLLSIFDPLGIILNFVINLLRGLLTPTLPLNNEELKELTETLKELSKLGYSISQEKLLRIAQSIAEINKITAGEWTAKLSLQALLPEEAQKVLCGSLDVEANGDNHEPAEDGAYEDGPPREKREAGRSKRAVSCTYNIEFDARKEWPGCKPIIDYVQNQGYCGSCWAHSVASAYTDRYCIEKAKKKVSIPNNATFTFSAYDLLSCSKEKGCDGGLEKDAWKWIEKNGICTGTDFPRKNGCKPYPFAPTVKNPQLQRCSQSCTNSGWRPTYPTDRKHYVTSVGTLGGEANIKDQLKKYGSVSAAFVVYEDFQGYKDGVYRYVKGERKGGHAIVIVGYGTATCDGGKIPFWIIRNSWGPKWGKGGFFYIRRGKDECNIETRGVSYGVPKI